VLVTAIVVSAAAVFGNILTAVRERRVTFVNCLFIGLTLGLSYLVGRPVWLTYDLLTPIHHVFDPIVKLIDRWA